MRKHLNVLAALLVLISVSALYADVQYIRYQNVRFGFGISYPKDILISQGESINGDGQKFISNDGAAIAFVYGYNNPGDYSLTYLFSEKSTGYSDGKLKRKVTYKVITDKWFVVSGVEEKTVFYEKVYYRNDQFINFSMKYPTSKRKIYDPIIAEMSKSFKLIDANGFIR